MQLSLSLTVYVRYGGVGKYLGRAKAWSQRYYLLLFQNEPMCFSCNALKMKKEVKQMSMTESAMFHLPTDFLSLKRNTVQFKFSPKLISSFQES